MIVYNKMIESAIQGLVLLGRTREEAIKEVQKNQDLRYQMMIHEDMEAQERNMR